MYESALKGFSATLTDEAANALSRESEVDYVVPDAVIKLDSTQQPTPSWGLDRIDQLNLPLNDQYTYTQTGQIVHAYVIDTGVRASHTEFTGRIGSGYDFIDNDNNPDDCNGHGTHVAGTIGGTIFFLGMTHHEV